MDQIIKQVSRARRRLWIELFLNRLVRCLFVSLLVAVVAVAIPKLVAVQNLPDQWSQWWIGGALAAGALAALGWMLLNGRDQLDAAIEIDRRFGLRERVASSLSLPPGEQESPAGKALLADAQRAVRRISVEERFRVRLDRIAWLPLAPAIVAFGLVMFVDNKQAESSIDPSTDTLTKQRLEESTKALRERLKEQKKDAEKKGLKDAEEMFRRLEEGAEELAGKDKMDRKQALVKLNNLRNELEKRRQQMGGDEELRKQMEAMQGLQKGPADKLLDAMKQGDWDKAKQELQKLQAKMQDGNLSPEDKKALMEQLEQLKQKLEQANAQRQQMMEDLKKQIQQQKQQGNLAQAGQLQQKLDQMMRQQQQMNQMNKLAQQMAQCQQCMQQGDQQGAAQAMQQMMQQMDQLQQQLAEGAMLDAALDQLQLTKNAMGCQQCQGQGCQACMGMGFGQFGDKPSNSLDARGEGPGGGKRSDEENQVKFRDTMVRQKPGAGAATVVGMVDGPNMRGLVSQQVKEQMAATASAPADPIIIEQLPKSRREHTQEYFEMANGE